jgi:three-Cys-motif partner protein
MAQKSNQYKGREHSGIKHYLLESYLERLFMIIGQHERRICYVDCFAGPWKESDENLSGTSISLSLDVMHKCRDSLLKMGKSVEFRALYIEKGIRAYKKLDAYLKEIRLNGITTHAMNGEFHELSDNVLRWCGTRDFAFFFIDPKGWKNAIEIPTLTPLLLRHRSEYLINFMYDFLNRHFILEQFQKDMEAIFGEIPDISNMLPKQREDYLIQRYLNSLKSIPANNTDRLRSAYVSILDPVKERTKYHLVYLTRHPLGIVKFMDASEKMNIVQKTVRARTKQQHRIDTSGQEEMDFIEVETANIDDTVNMETVKQYWLDKLPTIPREFSIENLADMLEETNWFEKDLQQAFNELIDEGKAVNLDMLSKRPKKPVHFDKNERLQRIEQ